MKCEQLKLIFKLLDLQSNLMQFPHQILDLTKFNTCHSADCWAKTLSHVKDI